MKELRSKFAKKRETREWPNQSKTDMNFGGDVWYMKGVQCMQKMSVVRCK
jgi:hypothetical protein